MRVTSEAAEALALEAVGWIAGTDDLLSVFIGATGIDPGALAGRLSQPETLAAILDFLFLDDAWVLAFMAQSGVTPETLRAARACLPGGQIPDWT